MNSDNCTFVVSRAGDLEDADRRAFEDAFVAALRERGAPVLIVPHVYYLTSAHPAVGGLREADGRIVMVSWLHPRPAFWTLYELGVRADCECRRPLCLAMGAFRTAESCAESLFEAAGLSPAPAGAKEALVTEIKVPVESRWYPVIDYDRCSGCRKCFDFCLFEVYSFADGTLRVVNPDHCKPGCPACARICPAGAIMFPHCPDEAVAGAPGAEVSRETGPANALNERARCAAGAADGLEDLDNLIDQLDRLDE